MTFKSNTSTRFGAIKNNLLRPVLVCALLAAFSGCQPLKVNNLQDRLQPSNFRDWATPFSKLPFANVAKDGQIELHNIRNNHYLTENDFVANYYDRTFALSDIQSVDFVFVPFKGTEFMAHTMMSFGFKDGSSIGISAEIRTEKGEEYSPSLSARKR